MIGEKLKAWREARGLSQEAVGARLNVSRETVTRVERGKQPPGKALRGRIENLLSQCDPITNDDHSDCDIPFSDSGLESIPVDQLEQLIRRLVDQRDWASVNLVSKRLLDLKLAQVNAQIITTNYDKILELELREKRMVADGSRARGIFPINSEDEMHDPKMQRPPKPICEMSLEEEREWRDKTVKYTNKNK